MSLQLDELAFGYEKASKVDIERHAQRQLNAQTDELAHKGDRNLGIVDPLGVVEEVVGAVNTPWLVKALRSS